MPSCGRVFEAHGLRLDGDAALALDIHAVEDLLGHLARREGAGGLDQPVGKRRFPVVDMGHDGEIADIVKGARGHSNTRTGMKPCWGRNSSPARQCQGKAVSRESSRLWRRR